MLSVLFISLKVSIQTFSLSKSLSPLKKLHYLTTLLLFYGRTTMALLEKRALSFDKKSHMAGAEKRENSLPALLFTSYDSQADKTRFGHNSWFLEGTRLMRKITYTVLSSHTWGVEKRSASFLSLSFFLLSRTKPISTILLSLSLFCLFLLLKLKTFFFSFRVLAECFYRSGERSGTCTHWLSCALAPSSLPSPGHALRIRSVRHHFWTGLALGFFACWQKVWSIMTCLFARFFLFFYVGGIITPGVM